MKQTCPRCGSAEIDLLSSTYPRALECKQCGLTFVTTPQALIDE
jgi:transcription elongation factor Elf1